MWVQVPSSAPSRSKCHIVCSDFFYKPERTHFVAPPFQTEPAAAGLRFGLGNDFLKEPVDRIMEKSIVEIQCFFFYCDSLNEALYSSPQFNIASRIGLRLCPSFVNVYSTLGGTSAYTVRVNRPLSSMARSCAVNTFCDTLPTDFFNSPNLFVPVSRSRKIKTFHLSPIKDKVVSTGQAGNSFTVFCVLIDLPPNRSCLKPCVLLYHTAFKESRFRLEISGNKIFRKNFCYTESLKRPQTTHLFPFGNCPIVTSR